MSDISLPGGERRAQPFALRRTRVAVALQCLPLPALTVLLLDLLTGGALFEHPGSAAGPAWPLGLPLLLSGAGYLAIKRWRRAVVAWFFGVCSWLWLSMAFGLAGAAAAGPGAEAMAYWSVGSAAVASVLTAFEVRRLGRQPTTHAWASRRLKNLLTCGIVAALLGYFLLGFDLLLTIGCSYAANNCI